MDRKLFFKTLMLTTFSFSSLGKSSHSNQTGSPENWPGDGKADMSENFNRYLAQNDLLQLPPGKIFKIGNVILKGKKIIGPAKIALTPGAKAAFILEGTNNVIENVEFISQGSGKRPESEIHLGKELEFATIKGCSFRGQTFSAIGSLMNAQKDAPYAQSPWRSKLRVEGCFFHGTYAHHLYFHRLKEVVVTSNFFESSKLDSIRLRQWVENIIISHNHFKNIGTSQSSDSKDAIDCYWSGVSLNIQNNIFDNIATHCMDIKGHSPDQDYGTSKVIITDNQIQRVGFSAILISSGAVTSKGWRAVESIVVSNNHIQGCGHKSKNSNDAAIFMRHNQEMIIIEGNQIHKNHQKGIMLGNFEKNAPISRNIIIKGNMIVKNKSFGIHILGGENILVSSNILDKNKKNIVSEHYRNFKLKNFLAIQNIESEAEDS